jgi:hypothetical protein
MSGRWASVGSWYAPAIRSSIRTSSARGQRRVQRREEDPQLLVGSHVAVLRQIAVNASPARASAAASADDP